MEPRVLALRPSIPIRSLMDLSIICVNWNSLRYLRECLKSIYDTTHGVEFEVIVVDNASTDPGFESLKDSFPDIITIALPQNIGFAGANNVGFRHSTGDCVLLLNPDTLVTGPAVQILLDQIKALPDAGIMGCRLLNTDLSVQLTAIQNFPTILNQVMDVEYLQLRWPSCPLWNLAPLFEPNTTLVKVEVISGACMLLRREVFAAVGMFSEDYFMYAEDIDLNYKVRQAGYSNYYCGSATIVHHGGRSSSQQGVSHWSTLMKYRAMRRLFRKTHGPLYSTLYRTAIGCAALMRLLLLAVAFPFSSVVFNGTAIRVAAKKWAMILRWAVGAAPANV